MSCRSVHNSYVGYVTGNEIIIQYYE